MQVLHSDKNILNKVISKYSTIYSADNEAVSIYKILDDIKTGVHKSHVEECRKFISTNNIDNYKKAKTRLPAVTFSGLFSGSHRVETLQLYSNLIVIDIDNISFDDVESIKTVISKDDHIISIWKSPSELGLKCLIPVKSSQNEHKVCFDTLVGYFNEKYSVNVDKSGSDICRLCFVSYDEEILIKRDYTPFDYTLYFVDQEHHSQKKKKPEPISVRYNKSEKILLYDTKGRNRSTDRSTIAKIIKYLRKNNLSITEDYDNWYRVAIAIANTFTFELGLKYYIQLSKLDSGLYDEYKCKALLEYCYRNRRVDIINFATIIYLSQKKGFILKENFRGNKY